MTLGGPTMLRTPSSWNQILAKLGKRRTSCGSRNRVALQNYRRLNGEMLEDRRMLVSDFVRTDDVSLIRGFAAVGPANAGAPAGDIDQTDWGTYVNTSDPFENAPLLARNAGIGLATVSDARVASVAQGLSATNAFIGSRQRVPYVTTTSAHISNAIATAFPAGATGRSAVGTNANVSYVFDDDDDDLTPNFLHIQGLAAAFGSVGAGGTGLVNQLDDSTVGFVVLVNGQAVTGINFRDENRADPNGNWEGGVLTTDGFVPINAGSGFNRFVYDVVEIQDGDLIEINANTFEVYDLFVGNDSGHAEYNLAATANAWVFVRDTATPIQNGDVDMDGDVDQDDFNIIVGGFPTNQFNSNWADIDGDSDVDDDDISALLLGYPSGADLLGSPSTLQEGDADHDGDIDRADIGEWLANAPANFLLVSEESDVVDGNYSFEHLSLREALSIADDGDTILFAPWVDEITLGGAQLTVADDLTIAGPGADKLTIDANGLSRVFSVLGAEATIFGVTITGGNASVGGGIYASQSDLTVRDTRVTANNASSAGGGIFATDNPRLRVERTEVSDNDVSNGVGGGIATYDVLDGEIVEILNSTISGNEAKGANGYGGGLHTTVEWSQTISIINSTIAYNYAAVDGGGIYADNTFFPANITTKNSIIAENSDSGGDSDVAAVSFAIGSTNNLLGRGGSGGLSSGNIVLTSLQSARLKQLAYNGGKTRTHALYSDSLAIDAGDNSVASSWNLLIDQRGEDRIEDFDNDDVVDTIDIGALELAFDEIYT